MNVFIQECRYSLGNPTTRSLELDLGLLLDPVAVLVDARVHAGCSLVALLVGEGSHAQECGLEEDINDESSSLISGTDVALGRLSAEHGRDEVLHVREGLDALHVVGDALEAHLQFVGEIAGRCHETESGNTSVLINQRHVHLVD